LSAGLLEYDYFFVSTDYGHFRYPAFIRHRLFVKIDNFLRRRDSLQFSRAGGPADLVFLLSGHLHTRSTLSVFTQTDIFYHLYVSHVKIPHKNQGNGGGRRTVSGFFQ